MKNLILVVLTLSFLVGCSTADEGGGHSNIETEDVLIDSEPDITPWTPEPEPPAD